MKLSDETTSLLKGALLTEIQAIAIYQAECFLLKWTCWTRARRFHFKVCQKILREELLHRDWIETGIAFNRWDRLLQTFNRIGGYALGSAFVCLPARWNWALHSWAETQAAATYHKTREKIGDSDSVRATLQHATHQEMRHHRIFRRAYNSISKKL